MFNLSNLVTKGIISVITVATISTSALGVVKITQSLNTKDKTQTLGIKEEEKQETEKEEGSVKEAPEKALAFVENGVKKVIATFSPTPRTSATANAQQNSGCIITLFGQSYNVTSLINSHPGGNVFTCGADNTKVYQSQHGNDVSRMQRYLVTNGSTSTSGGTSSTTMNKEEENEREKQKQQMEEDWERIKKESENESGE